MKVRQLTVRRYIVSLQYPTEIPRRLHAQEELRGAGAEQNAFKVVPVNRDFHFITG